MKTFRAIAALVLVGVLIWLASPVGAVPIFARKYGFNCSMCHSNYPRLNDFGQRYRQNGYQLPGREGDEKTVLESPPPIAARTSLGFNVQQAAGKEQDLNQFQLNGLDLLSAGLVYRNIGYMVVYLPPIPAFRGVTDQAGALEMASVVFSNVASPWLNVRVGRFEPALVAFSAKRQLTASPYEAYELAFPSGSPLSETQEGIEVTGHGGGFEFAFGWLNGSATNRVDDIPSDVYLRIAKVFGQGEGQTAGQRIGLFGHFGQARPDPTLSDKVRQPLFRGGLDASLNLGDFNLSLQFLLGQDDRDLWGSRDNILSYGGFAELSFLPATDWVVLARYDGLKLPGELDVGSINRMTAAVRYYIWDNLALHLEYSYRHQNSDLPIDQEALTYHFATVRLDAAF
ncbi:MAG TPA: hypothetical protein VM425_07380 [Myxococcota bacterium]|nr:hypothetical protein [Myxococcota bacterium]